MITKSSKSLLLIVMLMILFVACQSDIMEEIPRSKSNELVSLNDDFELQRLVADLYGPLQGLDTDSDDVSIFELVDWNRVRRVEQPSVDRVSFAAARIGNVKDDGFLENLIITRVGDQQVAYRIRYEANEEWFDSKTIRRNFDEFSGYIRITDLEGEQLMWTYMEDGNSVRPTLSFGVAGSDAEECDQWFEVVKTDVTCDESYNCEFVQWSEWEFVACEGGGGPEPELPIFDPGDRPGGGGTGGGTGTPIRPILPLIDPTTPCEGDPVSNPVVAPTSGSGVTGGLHGHTRSGGTKFHDGIDIQAAPGSPLYAMHGGRVIWTRTSFAPGEYLEDSYGNFVIIESTLANGRVIRLRYNHMDLVGVNRNDYLAAGSYIGLSGTTGNAASKGIVPHVHIQARDASNLDQSIDPAQFMHSHVNRTTGQTFTALPCL